MRPLSFGKNAQPRTPPVSLSVGTDDDQLADMSALIAALERVKPDISQAYLHIDLDVLDVSVGRANENAASGGLTVDQLVAAVDAVFASVPVAAVALTAYDPRLDVDGHIAEAARVVCQRIANRAADRAAKLRPGFVDEPSCDR